MNGSICEKYLSFQCSLPTISVELEVDTCIVYIVSHFSGILYMTSNLLSSENGLETNIAFNRWTLELLGIKCTYQTGEFDNKVNRLLNLSNDFQIKSEFPTTLLA